jgi:hypothetical protein
MRDSMRTKKTSGKWHTHALPFDAAWATTSDRRRRRALSSVVVVHQVHKDIDLADIIIIIIACLILSTGLLA